MQIKPNTIYVDNHSKKTYIGVEQDTGRVTGKIRLKSVHWQGVDNRWYYLDGHSIENYANGYGDSRLVLLYY